MVILGAYLLGPALGAAAGGVGPALADLLSGYTVYVPATLVIKAAMGLLAAMLYRAAGKKAWGMVVCATAAEAVMVAGYWLFDALLMLINGGGRLGVCLSASAVGIPQQPGAGRVWLGCVHSAGNDPAEERLCPGAFPQPLKEKNTPLRF